MSSHELQKDKNYSIDFNFENRIRKIRNRYKEKWKILSRAEGERAMDAFIKQLIYFKTVIA